MLVKEMPSDLPALRCWGELRPLCVSWSFWKRAKHSSSLGSLLPDAHRQNTYCVARLETHLQNTHHVPEPILLWNVNPLLRSLWANGVSHLACVFGTSHGSFSLHDNVTTSVPLFLVVSLRSLPLPCSVHLQVPLPTSAQFSESRMTKQ